MLGLRLPGFDRGKIRPVGECNFLFPSRTAWNLRQPNSCDTKSRSRAAVAALSVSSRAARARKITTGGLASSFPYINDGKHLLMPARAPERKIA
jgi:hypothetical protein